MNVTQKIKMDLLHKQNTVIDVMQGDSNTRILEMSLYSGGVPWKIPEGVSVAIAYRGASGNGIYDTLPNGDSAYTISGNVVTAILIPQVMSVDGDTTVTIVFTDANGKQLATFGVTVRAEPNPEIGAGEPSKYHNLREWASTPFWFDVLHGGIVEDPYDDLQREYEAGRELICRLETDDQQKLDLPLVEVNGQPYVFRFNAISGGVEWTVEISYRDGGAAVAAVTSNSLGKPTLYVDLVGNDPKALKSSVPFADIVAAHQSGRAVAVRIQSYRMPLVSIAADHAVFQCNIGSAFVYVAIYDDDTTKIKIDSLALLSDIEGIETSPEIYIGNKEPTDPNVSVWINPDEEPPVPGGVDLSGYAKKDDIPTDEHINSLINTALVGIPNAAEVAY